MPPDVARYEDVERRDGGQRQRVADDEESQYGDGQRVIVHSAVLVRRRAADVDAADALDGERAVRGRVADQRHHPDDDRRDGGRARTMDHTGQRGG